MIILILFYFLIISHVLSLSFEPCPEKPIGSGELEPRKLVVVTCETKGSHRVGWMKNDTLLIWNSTGIPLRNQGLSMINACEGKVWKLNQNNLLTKPMSYHEYLTKLVTNATINGIVDLTYVILMDSDTFWGVNDISEIWYRFDCVRKDKQVVVSTEMGCWMGFHCSKNDTDLWYPNIKDLKSYSPFVNSGVIMGKASILLEMETYILRHNKSYLTFNTKKKIPAWQFHDQHAVSDYSIRIKPDLIAKDYHQQFAGSLGIELPGGAKDSPVACKTLEGTIDFHCKEVSVEFAVRYPKYYQINETTCQTKRVLRKYHAGFEQLESIASHPAIWHGNGKAKKLFLTLGGAAYICHLRKAYPGVHFTVPLFNATSH